MALSQHERQVLLMNLRVEMVPQEATAWSVAMFFQAVKKIYDQGAAADLISDEMGEEGETAPGKNLLKIADVVSSDDGTLALLFHHGDARATDPALMHLRTGAIRTAGKSDADGLAHAAHLVLQPEPPNGGKSSATHALLERVPSLGRSTVIAFLNTIVRKACQVSGVTFLDSATGRALRYHPKLTVSVPASATLKADLKAGRISRIEFFKHNVTGGFDEENVIKPVELRFVHEVDGKVPISEMIKLFARSRAWARDNDFDEMQVHYKRSNKTHHPRFSTEYEDAEDAIFARHEVIEGFAEKLLQCPEVVVSEVLSKMHAFFGRSSLWK